jgi:hypothetical protein
MESKRETKCPGIDHRYTYLALLHYFLFFFVFIYLQSIWVQAGVCSIIWISTKVMYVY